MPKVQESRLTLLCVWNLRCEFSAVLATTPATCYHADILLSWTLTLWNHKLKETFLEAILVMAFYHSHNRVTTITDLSYYWEVYPELSPHLYYWRQPRQGPLAGYILATSPVYFGRNGGISSDWLSAKTSLLLFLPTPGHPAPSTSSAGERRRAERKATALIPYRGGPLSLPTRLRVTEKQPESWP